MHLGRPKNETKPLNCLLLCLSQHLLLESSEEAYSILEDMQPCLHPTSALSNQLFLEATGTDHTEKHSSPHFLDFLNGLKNLTTVNLVTSSK